ncbi:MAG: YggS family pyridoxal phosphate-dependent enzyme [Lacunisphaera sp.]|jgi:pyridoxal phosphate enzyme (YggS family)|nr:YggS family pyridoxal phosphate-dependent enzyme [Lacunisphaera sp.]
MFIDYEIFRVRADALLGRIAALCRAAGRDPQEVTLLPVTKTHPAAVVDYAARYGLAAVGENRVQEAVEKRAQATAPVRWELIGHLQSNKAKLAATHFGRIQSVDSEKLLIVLDRAAGELGRKLPVLLQVNAGLDPAKSGAAPADAPRLLDCALARPHLQVDGLMTIAPLSDDPAVARRTFAHLRTIRDQLAARTGAPLRVLSMGMSGDIEAAIAEGSTLVRVGSALFGPR